jgi:hypothetical protein
MWDFKTFVSLPKTSIQFLTLINERPNMTCQGLSDQLSYIQVYYAILSCHFDKVLVKKVFPPIELEFGNMSWGIIDVMVLDTNFSCV